jgi:hypothetical protein
VVQQRSVGVPVRVLQGPAERFAQRLGVQIGFLDSVRDMVLQTEKSVEKA